jgi:hypothetical protein
MNRLAIIVLTGLLMTAVESMASERISNGVREATQSFAKPEFVFNHETGVLLHHHEQAPCGTTPRPVEEESEDEDDTKEKVLQKTITMNHCLFLRQLFSLQYSIFKNHHKEIVTPPPKV